MIPEYAYRDAEEVLKPEYAYLKKRDVFVDYNMAMAVYIVPLFTYSRIRSAKESLTGWWNCGIRSRLHP